MEEQWVRWEPLSHLASHYYLESIFDDIDTLEIILSEVNEPHRKLAINFETGVDNYKTTLNSANEDLLLTLEAKYGKDFFPRGHFLKCSILIILSGCLSNHILSVIRGN